MAKTRLLNANEVEKLRENILKRFKERNPQKHHINISTYKEGYEELKNDIILVIPHAAPSISLNRLRKLFYYTNPEYCKPEHLVKPSFGKDFLDALECYLPTAIEEHIKPSESYLQYLKFMILLLFLLSGFAVYYNYQNRKLTEWREDFNDVSMSGLKSRGWDLLHFDSSYWFPQKKEGAMTLKTIAGDIWLKPGETQHAKNIIFKKIKCECCEINFKIFGFYPNQNWQQAGIVLFDESGVENNFIRITYGFDNLAIGKNLDGKIIYDKLKIQKVSRFNKEMVFNKRTVVSYPELTKTKIEVDTVYIKIKIANGISKYFFKTQYDWLSFIEPTAQRNQCEINFKPSFLGVLAFHGYTDRKRNLLNADTIPVYFDYIEVKPCP